MSAPDRTPAESVEEQIAREMYEAFLLWAFTEEERADLGWQTLRHKQFWYDRASRLRPLLRSEGDADPTRRREYPGDYLRDLAEDVINRFGWMQNPNAKGEHVIPLPHAHVEAALKLADAALVLRPAPQEEG